MKKPIILLLHLLYWIVYFSLLSLLFELISQATGGLANFAFWNKVMSGFAFIPALIAFYISYTLLFSRLLAPRRIGLLILASLGVAIGATIFGETLLRANYKMFNWTIETMLSMGLFMSVNAALNGIAGLGLKSFVSWYNDLKWKEALMQRTHEMELTLVRAQLSPHFLFNTINNIDVLIEQDSARASAYLNKLSDIMRFMIYETKTPLIPLEKELAYIDHYISLQQIRSANPDYAHYQVQGDAGRFQVAPMVFIPFIENAFKHSIPQRQGNVIDVAITIAGSKVTFRCSNHYGASRSTQEAYSGLGNELIEKRLSLLYQNRHQLTITDQDHLYTITLTLPLSDAL